MSYPDPCAECGGVNTHRPWDEAGVYDLNLDADTWCSALDRGAGTFRNQCGSIWPRNRNWVCRKPKGHEATDPMCFDSFDAWGLKSWLYQDAIHPQPVDDIAPEVGADSG